MKSERIRKLAEERVGFGYSRQHVFDELRLQHPEVAPKKIAQVVRYVPSQAAREHFRWAHQALLAAIVVYGAIQVGRPLLEGRFEGAGVWQVFQLMPLATLFLGYAVFRWRGEVLPWLAFLNGLSVFGLFRDLSALVKGEAEPWGFALRVLSITIAALAIYLSLRLYPKYKEMQGANGQPMFIFEPEPGMRMM